MKICILLMCPDYRDALYIQHPNHDIILAFLYRNKLRCYAAPPLLPTVPAHTCMLYGTLVEQQQRRAGPHCCQRARDISHVGGPIS